jgi:hypothetical protein
MGLAADESARKALEAVTAPYHPGGCMFGCHMRDGFEPDGKTVHQMARENNIPLREDVLNTAMATFAADFLNAAGPAGGDRRRIGVIGFSQVALLLQAPTNNAADVLDSFAAFPNTSRLNTYFEKLYDAVAMVGPQGNGTQASPRKTVLLITDGMAFMREDPYAWWRGPIRQSICDMVKSLDLKLAVLEIKYQAAPGNPSFDAHVADVFPKVSPALEACATPGLYFVAEDSDTASLHEAFAKLGSALQSQLALTQ